MRYKSQPLKISASTASSFSKCEQRFAFERLIEDVPFVPTPIQLVFGTVVHKAHERMWRHVLTGKNSLQPSIVNYWLMFLNQIFDGRHGPEGESTAPLAIRWLTPAEQSGLTEQEINEKIEEKKKKYRGTAYLAFRALYLECTAPSPFVRTEVEYDFSHRNITIKSPLGTVEYAVSGRIDRIQFRPNDDYIVLDLKTGAARYQRDELIGNIQMTMYQYACQKIFGRPPKQMFIQPTSLSKEFLQKHQEKALEQRRIPVEIREDPIHFENLALLIEDVRDALNFVIDADRYSDKEKNEWQPSSNWGRMARFTDNVSQGRFVPRIGLWCEFCPFLELCQKVNADDWQAYRQSLESEGKKLEPAIEPLSQETPAAGQKSLFHPARPKSKYLPKSERQIKEELKESKHFITLREAKTLPAKIQKLIPLKNGRPCPCRRHGFVPYFLLENFRKYKENKITLVDLINNCPYSECPHREPQPAV